MEQLVTLPIETTLNGTSNLALIRSSSAVGLSAIICTFEEGTDIFRARQLVSEVIKPAEAARLFGKAPQLTAAIERDYLSPWTADHAQARYLERFARLARE